MDVVDARATSDGRRRLGRLAGVGLLAVVTAVVGGSTAAIADPSPQSRFRPAPAGAVAVTEPLSFSGDQRVSGDRQISGDRRAAGDQQVTVVVELPEQPVAVVEAEAPQPLTRTQRRERKDQLRQRQAPVAAQVRELGGTVLSSYQSAYNGIKVRISASGASALRDRPDVTAVRPVQRMSRDNSQGVPIIKAPTVWGGAAGVHGEGIKIAVIDTGIDYTHADFGGPGTVAAYRAAQEAGTAPADPTLFGPGAAKVKGGIDLVGDDYNADPSSEAFQPVPHPDPNPLDCNGHGTHVAGTAAGFGVLGDGSTYPGPYTAETIASHDWLVGPGVAPKADLYAVRVFGCAGSTDVTVDAIEWAVDNDMDVINMSLGAPFGSSDDPTAVAASNATRKGVIVVASSGNAGHSPYITGSPGAGTGVISVAASDAIRSSPGARLAVTGGPTVEAIVANGVRLDGGTLPVKVLRTGEGVSLGCDPAEYNVPGVAGALVVVRRGTCARVARAVFGQQAGAAAVLMINNVDALPPFEGPITGNPDTGEPYRVTIPFLGVSAGAGPALVAADGTTVSLAAFELINPDYRKSASFTSGGPRTGDSWLKPDVTAPGVSIFSAGVGTGSSFGVLSGTSMAAPHTAGLAALVKQSHPGWKRVEYWKAAIVNTADPGEIDDYSTRLAGSGLVQAPGAVDTQVVALGDRGTATLNFGHAELDRDFVGRKTVQVRNFGDRAATFNVAIARSAGSPHRATPKRSRITVPARGTAEVEVQLAVPARTAGGTDALHDVAGLVTLTPVGSSANRGVVLRVPYYLVPQAVSHVATAVDTRALSRTGTATATMTNRRGAIAGTADWYAWGLTDGRDREAGSHDLRAVGVKSADGLVMFAISTHERWSNAAVSEYTVFVDVNGDTVDDYAVVGIDEGRLLAGDDNGVLTTAVYDLRTDELSVRPRRYADAPFNSSTLVLPVAVDQFCATGSPCLSPANPRLTYRVETASPVSGTPDTIDARAGFNAFAPAISTGVFAEIAPGATVRRQVSVDRTEWATTAPLGLMVVTHENPSADEAALIAVR